MPATSFDEKIKARICISADSEGSSFCLYPPASCRLELDRTEYKLLLPYSRGTIDVAVDGLPVRRLTLRHGDLVFVEPANTVRANSVEPLEFMVVTLTPDRVRRAAEAAVGQTWRTRNLLPWRDAAVAAVGIEMRRALLGEGLPPGPYLAALSDALIARTVVHVAAEQKHVPRSALSPATLTRVLRHIDASLSEPIAVEQLAEIAQFSTAHFARSFARETGDPPHRYVMKRRVCRARDLLSQADASIADIAARTGFSSQAHLSTAFAREVGVSPAKYRAAFAQENAEELSSNVGIIAR